MSQVVHITFEKLTGLKGTIEGEFLVSGNIDIRLPLVLEAFVFIEPSTFIFRQGDELVRITPIDKIYMSNYMEHFHCTANYLIKEWSYGRGVTINSQSPN